MLDNIKQLTSECKNGNIILKCITVPSPPLPHRHDAFFARYIISIQTLGQDVMIKNRSIVEGKRQYRRFIHEYPDC